MAHMATSVSSLGIGSLTHLIIIHPVSGHKRALLMILVRNPLF
jgi:hypothetical protein